MARKIINADVSSYYPSLMIQNGYVSRNLKSDKAFSSIYNERLEAKKNGDKATANSLKLIVNTTYGAMLNQYNDLYDPLNARSVCISGQLYLLELAVHVVTDLETIKLIQLNTDGVCVSIDDTEEQMFYDICSEWMTRTGFELEYDEIALVVQKDVNSYCLRKLDGQEKTKGGYLVRGMSTAGAFSINNNSTIVADALKAYLLDGTPIADTINACNDVSKFQIIAKASSKYSRVYQTVWAMHGMDEILHKVPCQKCNRVFATTNDKYGRLFKVKSEDGSVAKIESLPEHCLIFNGEINENTSIPLLDKKFYIELGEKRAQDFKEVHMATATKKPAAQSAASSSADYSQMNIYQKLAIARLKVLEAGITPSGKNYHMEFEFFELKDIAPVQLRVFEEVGLLEVFNEVICPEERFIDEVTGDTITTREKLHKAVSTIINLDNPDEKIEFVTDWAELAPIVSSKTGAEAQNALQRKGSETTYLRRYNKLKILDLTEQDVNEAQSGAVEEKKAAKSASSKKPATAAEQKEAAKVVTNADGAASKLLLGQLKKSIKTLQETYGKDNPELAAYVSELANATDKLKNITQVEAEKAIRELGELKEKFETEDGGE